MKIKIVILMLALMYAGISLSKSIHKLTIDTKGAVSYWSNTDILNGQLFFQDSFTEYLWVTDGTNSGSHILEYNQQPIQLNLNRQSLLAYEGSIYYINKSDGNTLWKTDGQNFEKISDESFSVSKGLKVYSNHLIGALSDHSLVLIDENGIQSLDLGGLSDNSINSICILGSNNYIINSHFADSTDKLYHIQNGLAQVIGKEINNFGSFGLALVYNNTCFYKYQMGDFQENTNSSFIAIDDAGIVTKIETEINEENINSWNGIVEFMGSVYFYPKNKIGDFSTNYLYEYKNSYLSANEDLILQSSTVNIFSSNNYLYVQKTHDVIVDPIPPGYKDKTVLAFDSKFNNVYSFSSGKENHEIVSNDMGEDTIVLNYEISKLGFIQSSETQTLETPSIALYSIVGDSQSTYIYGYDRNNNKSSIYVVKNEPIISQNLDGLWYVPEHQSQGLSIHTGERVDGTQYLFASFYLFKDGVPFWIAGSTDLNFENTLSLSMYEYTGSSPYLPNDIVQNSQRIKYGTLTLEALSCDFLDFQMTQADNSNFNLVMERLGRSQGAINCID